MPSFRRSKPLRRRKPLRRSGKPLRRTRLRRVSVKREADLREYFRVRRAYLDANPWCEAGTVITRAKLPTCYSVPRCEAKAAEVHHTRGRGPHLCDVATFCAVCRTCHRWIHEHAQKARDLGLLY